MAVLALVNNDGIREVRFDEDATVPEIGAVWERLDYLRVGSVMIGEVLVDPYDMDQNLDEVTPVALAVVGVQTGGPSVRARWVGSDRWLSVGFSNVLDDADEPTPSDGARAVLRLLEALDPSDLPDDLDAIVAHRVSKQADLVSVDRVALERLGNNRAVAQRCRHRAKLGDRLRRRGLPPTRLTTP